MIILVKLYHVRVRSEVTILVKLYHVSVRSEMGQG